MIYEVTVVAAQGDQRTGTGTNRVLEKVGIDLLGTVNTAGEMRVV